MAADAVMTQEHNQISLVPTTLFGRYHLIGRLGHGGMADVYLAYVTGPGGFKKLVVIKRLHPHLEEEVEFIQMFLDEARLAARLNHPNVVQTHEVGAVEGSHFIAMEYLEGQGVNRIGNRNRRNKSDIPVDVTAQIAVQALSGLHYAHELKDYDDSPIGVVHRDVSPHNIFVTYEGQVKLLDFGIAKAATQIVETRAGMIKGKFSYIAPEQARSQAIDRRADLWSMGVVLWETIAGRPLFKGDNDLATLTESLTGTITQLKDVAPDTPELLSNVVMKALSRNPDERFQTALEMKDALQEFLVLYEASGSKTSLSAYVSEMFSDSITKRKQDLKSILSNPSQIGEMPELLSSELTPSGARSFVRLSSSRMTPVDSLVTPTSNPSFTGPDPSGFDSRSSYPYGGGGGGGNGQGGNNQGGGGGKYGLIGIVLASVLLAVVTTFMLMHFMGDRDEGPQSIAMSATEAQELVPPSEPTPSETGRDGAASEGVQEKVAETPSKAPEAADNTDEGDNRGEVEQNTVADTASGSSAASNNSNTYRARSSNWRGRSHRGRSTTSGRSPSKNSRATTEDQDMASQTAEAEDSQPEEPQAPAPPPPPSPAPRPEEEEFGFLTLDTAPWSRVVLGGRQLGTTPLIRVRLPSGTHNLSLSNPEAGISTVYRVTIRSGQTTAMRLGL